MSEQLPVNLTLVRPIIMAAVDRGASLSGIFADAGVDEALMNDTQATVTLAQRWALLRSCERRTGDPFLGLRAGNGVSPMILGIAGHLMETSADMATAFENLARFSATFSKQISFVTERSGDTFRFIAIPIPLWEERSPETVRAPIDLIFSAALFLFKLLNGRHVKPILAHYRCPRPGDGAEHQQHLRVKPLWEQEHNMLVFRAEDMALPVIGHDPQINQHFEMLLQQRLASMGSEAGVGAEVRRVILRHFRYALPTLPEVATHLHMTPRTLQRKLARAGTTFQRIADEVKRELSKGMLANERLTVAEVAYKLGYAEPAAFQRAFKQWTGTTPLTYRSSLATGGDREAFPAEGLRP